MSGVKYEEITSPSWEENEYYGGDAYTGMQQAAAQAANNMIPVFEAIEQGNEATKTLNQNMMRQANVENDNLLELVSALKCFIGLLVLSIGLLTAVKYMGGLIPEKTINDYEDEDEAVVGKYEQIKDSFQVEELEKNNDELKSEVSSEE